MVEWDNKSFDSKLVAIESLGFTQGDAVKLASLQWDNFTTEVQKKLAEVEDYTYSYDMEEEQDDERGDETYDYNDIGENMLARTKYQCDQCNSGYKSNEALSVHRNDVHAHAFDEIHGYDISASESSYYKKAREGVRFCSKCGAEGDGRDMSCGSCGADFPSNDEPSTQAQEMGDVLVDDSGEELDWFNKYGTSYTDGNQTIIDTDDEDKLDQVFKEEQLEWNDDKKAYDWGGESIRTCPSCGYNENDGRSLSCVSCGYDFQSNDEPSTQAQEANYPDHCPECDVQFSNEDELEDHEQRTGHNIFYNDSGDIQVDFYDQASELFGQNDPDEILGGSWGTPEDTAQDLYNMTSHNYSPDEYEKFNDLIVSKMGPASNGKFSSNALDLFLREKGAKSEDLIYDLVMEFGGGSDPIW